MGGFWTLTTTFSRTFMVTVVVVVTCGTCGTMAHPEQDAHEPQQQQQHPHEQFLEEFGLPTPNVVKTNISQEEYASKMSLYLTALRDAPHQPQDIPQLLTYNAENKSWRRKHDAPIRLHFHVKQTPDVVVQSADIRLLLPAHAHRHNATHIRVYQILGARRRRLLAKKVVYLSATQPKWADFDVSKAAEDWLSGTRNLGLLLECDHCRIETLRPQASSLNILIKENQDAGGARTKRSYEDSEHGSTDCLVNPMDASSGKPKCCRHKMPVDFDKLNMGYVLQPKTYEAWYCKGRCPHNVNYATNHSRIQNLVHRLDKRSTPRACCAPSKLKPLEVLMVDPNDASKLTVDRWDNMIVAECACS